MKVLICNVGSTSLKYQLLEMDDESVLAKGGVERVRSASSPMQHQATGKPEWKGDIKAPTHTEAISEMLRLLIDPELGAIKDISEVDAVGFKTVAARNLTGAMVLDDKVIEAMEFYSPVLPAHNPPYIDAIRIFEKLAPQIPRIGLFETSFHRNIPDYAYTYSVPWEWYEKYGVRRYAYHGASLRYVSERVPSIIGRPSSEIKLVACHLGGSSSVCAIKYGVSIDASMGFSTQAGVPMSNRSGDFDPFIIPYIMDQEGLTTAQVTDLLTSKAGLLGISGVSADMRDLEEAADKGNDRARLALETFAYDVKKYIGAYAAAMGGIDVLAFAGGIGENGIRMRQMITRGLEFLGIELDPVKNNVRKADTIVSKDGSKVQICIVPTNEEIIVARETVKVLAGLKK